MKEDKDKKLKKIQDLAKKGRIKFAPTYEISDFHYEFVEKVAEVRPAFISNESSLFDFSHGIKERDEREYWFSRIEKVYGIDLSDLEINDLNIAKLGSELEKRLEWKKLI